MLFNMNLYYESFYLKLILCLNIFDLYKELLSINGCYHTLNAFHYLYKCHTKCFGG